MCHKFPSPKKSKSLASPFRTPGFLIFFPPLPPTLSRQRERVEPFSWFEPACRSLGAGRGALRAWGIMDSLVNRMEIDGGL